MRFLTTDSFAQHAVHSVACTAAHVARQKRNSANYTPILSVQLIIVLFIFISTLVIADNNTDTQASSPGETPVAPTVVTPANTQVIDLLPDTPATLEKSKPELTAPQSTQQPARQAIRPGTRPTPFTAKYKVTKGIMSVGSTKRVLKSEGNGFYVFESVTKPGGIAKLFTSGEVIEHSYWRYQNNKLVPHEYKYTNSGDQKRNVKLEFDWDNYKVTNIINGDPWTMDIEEQTLDKLIYQLAIMYDLSNGKDKLLYQVADGGKMKTYDIKIEGEERLVTELGTFNTLKIVRATENRTTIMWCAREIQYLPAKIEQKKKDGSVTAVLVDLTGIPYTSKQSPTQRPAK